MREHERLRDSEVAVTKLLKRRPKALTTGVNLNAIHFFGKQCGRVPMRAKKQKTRRTLAQARVALGWQCLGPRPWLCPPGPLARTGRPTRADP